MPENADSGRPVLDLIAEFPTARHAEELSRIDLGHPSARRHLISGWGADEQDADGSYVWGLGETAALTFFAVAPTAMTLGLDCKPLVFVDMPEQTMSVALNGKPLGEVHLSHRLGHHELDVPATAVSSGQNRLDFRFAHSHRPLDVISGAVDARELALRCYTIELEGLGADGPPQVIDRSTPPTAETEPAAGPTHPDRLELPGGTSVTYYFDHSAKSDLVIARLESWGPRGDDIKLLVRSRSADATAETEHLIDPTGASGPLRIPLATDRPAVDRLEIAAVSDHRGQRDLRQMLGLAKKASGLSLILPSVHSHATRASEAAIPHAADDTRPPQPNIIIYLIDTLRADHLGAYGYDRPTSPNIDRFAADGILFENAQAQSSWTRPAVASLLTGLRPRAHGVNRRRDALSTTFDTLAELLAKQGYETAAFVTNGNAGPDFGLNQGFSHFRYLRESGETTERHQLSDSLNRWLFDWLEQRPPEHRASGGKPFFLFAHATDPHAPYAPREPFRSRFAPSVDPKIGWLANVQAIVSGQRETTTETRQALIDLYDAEIAFNDHHFGKLIDRLKTLGLYQSSLILLLSDHGEEFLEHGWWEHGVTLYGEQLDVPMILKLPTEKLAEPHQTRRHDAGKRINATVSQVDVLPTIFDLLELTPPATIDGKSLLGAANSEPHPSFAYLGLQNRLIRSVTRQGWKLILDDSRYPRGEPMQLYQVEVDPGETAELADQRPFERELLLQHMRRWELDLAQGAKAAGERAEIPDELRRQLEALGYL